MIKCAGRLMRRIGSIGWITLVPNRIPQRTRPESIAKRDTLRTTGKFKGVGNLELNARTLAKIIEIPK
jgi:hypothetical protein